MLTSPPPVWATLTPYGAAHPLTMNQLARTSQPEPFNICLACPTPPSGSKAFHIKVFRLTTLSPSTFYEAVDNEISSNPACTKSDYALYRRTPFWKGYSYGRHIGILLDRGSTEPSMVYTASTCT